MVLTSRASKQTASKTSTGKQYTWEEIGNHRHVDSLWIVVDHKVYDVTAFVAKHPGGVHALAMCGGQDITYLMQTSHPFTEKPWEILKNYLIGNVEGFVTYKQEEPFYDEIKQKVGAYFQRTGKDPKAWGFSLAVFAALTTMFVTGLYGLCLGSVWASILLGAARALLGINTMHACSHFSVTHSPFIWKWGNWFCFDILMGSSHWAWDYQHVIGHHQHTNVFGGDPDLPVVREGDMRRIVDEQTWKTMYKFQWLYLPVLYTLLAFKVHVYDIMYLFGYNMNGNLVMNQTKKTLIMLAFTKAFWIYYNFYVPLFVFELPMYDFLVCCLAMELTSGAYLAYCFQVNHISTDALYTDMDDKAGTTSKEWAALQVEGSVDYGHDSLAHLLLSGTLNYQTVHHLFPSVAPQHYPALAPLIKESCKKYGIKYACHDNYFIAAYHHIKELYRMGQNGQPAEMADFH